MASLVGGAPRLSQKRFPGFIWQTAAIPVGARRFPAVVEKAHVVVLALERLDLALDEVIDLLEIIGDLLRNIKVHHGGPSGRIAPLTERRRPVYHGRDGPGPRRDAWLRLLLKVPAWLRAEPAAPGSR